MSTNQEKIDVIDAMNFIVYSKPGCPYCVKIETLLDRLNLSYTEYMLDSDFTRQEFYEKFGNNTTFPQVVLNETQNIGGCSDTIKYLRETSIIN